MKIKIEASDTILAQSKETTLSHNYEQQANKRVTACQQVSYLKGESCNKTPDFLLYRNRGRLGTIASLDIPDTPTESRGYSFDSASITGECSDDVFGLSQSSLATCSTTNGSCNHNDVHCLQTNEIDEHTEDVNSCDLNNEDRLQSFIISHGKSTDSEDKPGCTKSSHDHELRQESKKTFITELTQGPLQLPEVRLAPLHVSECTHRPEPPEQPDRPDRLHIPKSNKENVCRNGSCINRAGRSGSMSPVSPVVSPGLQKDLNKRTTTTTTTTNNGRFSVHLHICA